MRADAADAPELSARGQEKSFLYDAFISYDHNDRPVAQGIQHGLHRVGRRVGRLSALRVFRDSTDLTARPDLWGKVTEAMDRSRYLIAVLSLHAVALAWVNKEVAYWLAHRGPNQLLLVVAGGNARRDFWCDQDPLPSLARGRPSADGWRRRQRHRDPQRAALSRRPTVVRPFARQAKGWSR